MKIITLTTSLLFLSTLSYGFTPHEDETVNDYRQAFRSSKGMVWDMNRDDNVYFDCDLYSARKGSAETSFVGFRVTRDGLSYKMNTNLVSNPFQGVALRPNKDEVYGRRGQGDAGDPLELIAIRVGAPISMEKPMIDKYKSNNTPAERIMSRPLYLEISQKQPSHLPELGFVVKPISLAAQKDASYRVKYYGVCYYSKYNSALNNSGVGYGSKTKHAWDEVDSSPWGAHPSFEGPF